MVQQIQMENKDTNRAPSLAVSDSDTTCTLRRSIWMQCFYAVCKYSTLIILETFPILAWLLTRRMLTVVESYSYLKFENAD